MRRFEQGSGAPVSVILAFVFPSMLAAALALAYYGFKYADSISGPIEALFRETASDEAQKLAHDLEAKIDEAATTLFQRVARDRASAGRAAADPLASEGLTSALRRQCDAERGLAVSSYVVLGAVGDIECHGPAPSDASAMRKAEREWSSILGKLDRDSVKPGTFNHHHGRTERGPFLVTFTARLSDEYGAYYVAARLDLEIIDEWLTELIKLRKNVRMVVLDKDDDGRLIAGASTGQPFSAQGRFLHDQPLGKALYRWHVYITPQNAEVFQAQAQRQKLLEPLLIILSTSMIAVGMGIVWLSVMAERRASRLKSDFIANVSHELKTPLSLIRMFGEMVATGRHKGEEAVKEYGAIITRESERLSHLIDNVLDFARLERGKASYDFAEGDLAEVVERALDVCRYRLDKEKLKLRTVIAPDLPPVRMDDNAMTLVILNLVDNAIKYAADGGQVDVTLARTPGGVVLSVRDRGQGISADEQARVFERFYRARNARDRNVRGSGIGLALVKHIAEAHGGRVLVESPVRGPGGGSGAVFRVYLPAPVSDTAGPAPDVTTQVAEAGRS